MNDFTWISFYMKFAEKLLDYKLKEKRVELVKKIMASDISEYFRTLPEYFYKLNDIDPFSVFAFFNPGQNRIEIANEIAKLMGMDLRLNENIRNLGIPEVNAQKATFVWSDTEDDYIKSVNKLWDFFEAALKYSKKPTDSTLETSFIDGFNYGVKLKHNGVTKITEGLFWINPLFYISLDDPNKNYIMHSDDFDLSFKTNLKIDIKDGNEYLNFLKQISKFIDKNVGFCEISRKARDFESPYWICPVKNMQKFDDFRNNKKIGLQKMEEDIKPGDGIFVNEKNKLYGYGIAESGCEKDNDVNSEYEYKVAVKWEKSGEFTMSKRCQIFQRLPFELIPEQLINGLDKKLNEEIDDVESSRDDERGDETMNVNYNINTILYGPPGTGKTYHTVEMAYDITKPEIEIDDNAPYKSKHDWFINEIKKEKSRVAFVTFHQSYSYEEFIEGIRPVIKEDDANNSSSENTDAQAQAAAASENSVTNNNSDKEGKDVGYILNEGVFKAFCGKAAKDPNNNYVFIIDEINRGNISKIFGELITLIEKTKREGADEEMSVTLPYTKKQFSVPQNVYIIGTMNTADRSIAMIDTALRRRFHFEEMMPKPELLKDITVDGVNIKDLLEKINKRIVYLYDREHQIGHSFFMELKNGDSIDKLKDVFQYNIIPLLQEYFYEDYEKIALVLGCSKKDGFIKKVDANIEGIFGKEQKDSSVLSDYDNGNTYELNDIKDFKKEWINRIINPDLNSENNEAQQESETGQESSEPDEEDDNSQE